MINKLWSKLTVALIATVGVLGAVLKVFAAGKKSKEQEVKEEVLEDVEEVKKARDKYQSDDDYAQRMRRKYTRK